MNLLLGFKPEESRRIEDHLLRLFPFLDFQETAVVGGLAIRHHLVRNGFDYPARPFNDLDLIVRRKTAVSTSISTDADFLIYHHHIQPGFYLAVVDRISRIKTDIFQGDFANEEFAKADLFGQKIKIPTIESQLVKTVFDLQRISQEKKVDPKQFYDAKMLAEIADYDKADELWRRRYHRLYPLKLKEVTDSAFGKAKNHPNWLKEKPFRKPRPYDCAECVNKADFPLTPMEEIYSLLGYVE